MAEVLGTVVGVISLGIQVAGGLIEYYTSYKDQESDTAHTVKRLTHLLTVFEVLRKQLAEREFQPDEKSLAEAIGGSVGDCEDLINELQHETEKFTKSPPGGFAATVRSSGRRLAYPFRQSTLQKLDEDIDEICANLALALQILQQQDTSSIQNDVQDTKALVELMRASQVSSSIKEWLKAPDASINYNEACKKKHPGTGLWLIKSPQFNTWLSTSNSFLWLKGFAGCGKSVLSSTIIQHTLRHRRSSPLIGIAFFYFTFNDESKQDTSAMLRALVLQLVSQLKDQDTTLSQFHDSYRENTPPDQALLDCLHQIISKFDHVYIILDALDESPRHKHREDLLQTLGDMRRWPGPGLHLLVTSRDEQDIRESLEALDDQIVLLKSNLVDADIASFVSGHLRDNRRLRKWEKYHDEIEQAFTKGAKGVFRWVECQFTALEACPGSKTRLNALLGSLPRTLDKTYERMLSNIEAESADDARRIMILLCTAKRPLELEELIDGIAVELGEDPRFNKDSRLMNEDDIRHICPGFIEIDEHQEDGMPWGPSKTVVRIAHYSVQEYLESDRILAGETARFSVRPMQASTEVASICLAYLMDPEVCEVLTRVPVHATVLPFPFARYAMFNWPDHYSEADGSDSRLHRLVVDLFHDGVAFVNWAEFLLDGYKIDFRKDNDGNLARLCLAARFGLDRIVRMLADKPVPIPRPKDYFGPALLKAAGYGHDTSVRLLLGYGANVDYLDHEVTALHLASRHGRVKVVETLLDHGADIEAHGIYSLTPLCEATATGRDEVVRLLLDRGADINPTCSPKTLLEVAASGGFENVVTALLDRGADPNRGREGSPLEAAAEHASIGQLLIRRGADIDQAGEALLERAALYGNTWMIRLLLDRGADVNVGKVNTPLEMACRRPWTGALQLLLDRGADVNLGIQQTPLEAVIKTKELKHVEILLDRGADASLGIRRTPLEAAAQMSTEDILQLLLDRGADVNLGMERTPLEVAAEELRIGHIQLLLDRGADVNLGIQQTPLEAAASKVRRRHVRFPLDPGAEANLDFEIILTKADTSGKSREAVSMLVCNGAGASGHIDTTLLELSAGQDGKALRMVQPDAGGRTETTLSQPADKKRNGIVTPRLSDSAEKAK